MRRLVVVVVVVVVVVAVHAFSYLSSGCRKQSAVVINVRFNPSGKHQSEFQRLLVHMIWTSTSHAMMNHYLTIAHQEQTSTNISKHQQASTSISIINHRLNLFELKLWHTEISSWSLGSGNP